MQNWVDFKVVKKAVTMRMILDRYGINWLRKSGKEFRGRCPIHNGGGSGSGEKGSASFQVNFDKDAFNCFSCDARGNVLDFVAAMEKCSVRDAALKLQQWFAITAVPEPGENPVDTMAKIPIPGAEQNTRGEEQPANEPLKFQLKGIDPLHSYLADRGITQPTAESFGAGFFSGKGSMSGRIVIPIHNERGELVAYAGRAIDKTEPKYKFPAGFHKSQVLFNFHRAVNQDDCLVILVEGFFDTMILHQAGFPTAVGLLGCQLSVVQEQLLVSRFEEVIVLLDGDEAGRTASRDIAARLVTQMFVRVVDLGDAEQPDCMSTEALRQLLSGIL